MAMDSTELNALRCECDLLIAVKHYQLDSAFRSPMMHMLR